MTSYGYTYEDYIKPRFNEISMWVRDGLNEKEIAKNLGVSYSRFRDFKKQKSALSALMKNSVVTNMVAEVETAMLESAKGYNFIEITEERIYDAKEDEFKMMVTKKVKKKIIGNVTAQKTILEAWKGDRYKNKQTIEHEGEVSIKKLEDLIK